MSEVIRKDSIVGAGDIVRMHGKAFRILDFDQICTMIEMVFPLTYSSDK